MKAILLALAMVMTSFGALEVYGQSKLIPTFDADAGQNAETPVVERTTFEKILDASNPARLIPKKRGPSLLARLNNGTKRVITKTRAVVVAPWKKLAMAAYPSEKHETTRTRTRSSRNAPRRQSFFSRLFSNEQPEGPPDTLREFMKLDRPH